MSARLVSRKPRPYASFVAVSISRDRSSGRSVRIFSDSEEVSYLTNSKHEPDARALSSPATSQFLGAGGWWTNPKGVGLNVSYLAKNSTDVRSPRLFPHNRLFRAS